MKKLNVLMAGMVIAVLASCGSASTGKVTMNDVKDTISYSIGMGRAVRVYKDQLPPDIIDSTTIKSFIKVEAKEMAENEINSILEYKKTIDELR